MAIETRRARLRKISMRNILCGMQGFTRSVLPMKRSQLFSRHLEEPFKRELGGQKPVEGCLIDKYLLNINKSI